MIENIKNLEGDGVLKCQSFSRFLLYDFAKWHKRIRPLTHGAEAIWRCGLLLKKNELTEISTRRLTVLTICDIVIVAQEILW